MAVVGEALGDEWVSAQPLGEQEYELWILPLRSQATQGSHRPGQRRTHPKTNPTSPHQESMTNGCSIPEGQV